MVTDNHITIDVNDEYLYNLYKAKSTIWYFDHVIDNGFEGYNSIKFKNENEVFVWLENVETDGKYYKGTLVENGQPHIISRNDAADWMIIDNERMIGAYTIRHYYDTLTRDEQLSFENYCGCCIDHGNDFFKADRSTPEGALMTLENFYNDRNWDGILSCKDFYWEAENVMLEHAMIFDPKTRLQLANVLKVSLQEDLGNKAFPNFEAIERVFNLLERRGEQELIEEKLIYADGFVTVNKFWVGLTENDGWKVLNLVD
ncbi:MULTISPECIES: DUF2314 domain-containing protein [Bacteroidota]|uniref:Uncharacterized protein conserved in bacteria (DUF2314) n=3 Tax=Bacteroidota TaxID=976 RepID=A0A2X2LQ14_SPHMU|nr:MULTISPECIES: DUF2314 domain-containing protein [Bacteroidota]AZB25149.1 DUF2314 domain-containing protein [Chryseobacterium bernardetii]QRQ63239.1 DUF2314 domain-containing protein [Sphingobacterium multivorum]SPZ95079.1 Uncharacterized protein conserved in bacteria (DUF2314) [Sphingobacterium multivorum]